MRHDPTGEKWGVLLLAAAWIAVGPGTGLAIAQDTGDTGNTGDSSTVGPEESAGGGGAVDEADFNAIDDLLEQGEEVLSDPGTYAYDPGTRRDPFRSLLIRRDLESEPERERPPGPAGLLIDEIEVEGVFILEDGPVVQVESASQETSFLLRPGDQLWDGDVISIDLEEVVFKQSVNDPTALKPFREVVKRLNP